MSSEAAAGLFGALAKGAETYVRENSPAAVADRATARARKAQGDRALAATQNAQAAGADEQALELLMKQQKDQANQIAKRDSYDAFRMYNADGNPEHLNRALRENPTLKEIYGGVASIDKLDITNDANLIQQAGLDLTDADPKAFGKRYLKVTRADGSKDIIDMFQVYQGTGYANHVSQQELEQMLKESQIAKNLREPKRGSGSGGGGKPTAMERKAAAAAKAQARIDAGEGSLEDEMIVKAFDKEVAGTTPGKHDLARDAEDELAEMFGGEEAFFKTDFSDPTNYRKAISKVTEIEQLEGSVLTTQQKRQLTDIRSLIALGDPGKDLSASETGIIDSMFLGVKKYTVDTVGGVGATSAYNAFRNTVRHALFGSALTEAEIKSFNEAFGTLGQKLGPVLQQFKTALNQVKANIDSLARMSNPYSAQVRLGTDQAQLDAVLDSIDSRIRFLSSKMPAQADKKRQLDKIFKGQ